MATSEFNEKQTKSIYNRKGIRIAILILLLAAVGTAIYLFSGSQGAGQKENISTIHEREVQKAIRELNAEKLAKKKAEQRRQLIKERKAEIQSLNAQLSQVRANMARALSELDDIRRPHLFRSRAKKEALLSEQLQTIDRLEAKAARLNLRISRCKKAIDSLSVGPEP